MLLRDSFGGEDGGGYDIAERTKKKMLQGCLLSPKVKTDILRFLSQRTHHTLNIMTSLVDTKYMCINALRKAAWSSG